MLYRTLAAAALLAAAFLAPPVAAQETVNHETRGVNLMAEYGRLLARKPSAAPRVVSMYTSYLQAVPRDGVWDHVLARVYTRRAEAYLARDEFTYAEDDFRQANRLWPGQARETLLRPLPSHVETRQERQAKKRATEARASSSTVWTDYWDLDEFAFHFTGRGGAYLWTDFSMEVDAPNTAAVTLDGDGDLGLGTFAPFGGFHMMFSIEDNVDLNLAFDILPLSGENDAGASGELSFHGVTLKPDGFTATLTTTVFALVGQFYMAAPLQDEGYSDVELGFHIVYQDTAIESTYTSHRCRFIHRSVTPFLGFRFGADLDDAETVFFSFALRAMWFYWPNTEAELTSTFLWARASLRWRPLDFLVVELSLAGQHFSWDEDKGSRSEIFTHQGLNGELGLTWRVS